MAVIERHAHVPYTALQMLTLVNDIGAYPEFLHWCQAARIESSAGQVVDAALEIGVSGVHKTMRTRNTSTVADSGSPARIHIEMLDGPLKRLHGAWTFTDSPASGGCDVELALEYEIHRTPFGMLLRALFDEIANSQLNAFVRRAGVVFGGH
jgi:ribosome-associated toxin RatA of RatAB toxin-antitoxin module